MIFIKAYEINKGLILNFSFKYMHENSNQQIINWDLI